MRATSPKTDHDTDTVDQGTENRTREEQELISIERILRTVDGMAVWGGDRDYERYGT